MPVFKTFYKIAKKHFGSMAIYLFIFLVLTLLLTNSSEKEKPVNFTASSLNICIQDEDNSRISAALQEYLGTLHTLVDLPNDKETLQDHLYYRNISYVLFIPKGFEQKILDGEINDLLTNVKIPGSYEGSYVDSQIEEFLSAVHLYITGGFSPEEALAHTLSTIQEKAPVTLLSEHKEEGSSQKNIYYFFLYLPYIFIMMLLSSLAPVLITFRKKDLDARMHCSTLPLTSKNLQIALASLLYGVGIWLLFLFVSFCVYGTDIFCELGFLSMLNSFVFLLVALAITLLVSFFSPTLNALNMIGNIIGLSMSFLCGVFVAQWLLPDGLSAVSRFLPMYWYVRAHNMAGGMSGETMDYASYFTCVGIQFLFAVAIFTTALMISRYMKNHRTH